MLRGVADQIAFGLVTTVYPVQVATVQSDGTLILNYGDTALAPGMILADYGPSEEIPDPGTGAMMRIDGTKLGLIEVTEATPQFFRAQALSTFSTAPVAGSVVREASLEDLAQVRGWRRR